jgi:hypothetical protein
MSNTQEQSVKSEIEHKKSTVSSLLNSVLMQWLIRSRTSWTMQPHSRSISRSSRNGSTRRAQQTQFFETLSACVSKQESTRMNWKAGRIPF